ncbi:MAG: HD domain-containing protein, partial [Gammaproteobacteria bacterium]|nr:HD domain-containing protein [Gammaproteobacteria bacterium]
AQELGLEDDTCNVIRHAAPMHDIGKIGVPDQILLKRGKLTRQEWNSMQVHTRIGYEILRDSPSCFLKSGAVIALGHHERFDGKGYPNGLLGDKTPIEARVAAVADVFDALMSERPYKAAWTMERTLDYMREQRARHFDPDCIDAFFTKLDNIMTIRHQFADRVESVSN